MTTTTHSTSSVDDGALYVAFELGKQSWTLGVTSGFGVRPRVRAVPAGDFAGVRRVLTQARASFGVAASAPVWSCYEAGRDGFWIHRALATYGVQNRVVDSSSIQVDRRARRTKTDRLDAVKLVTMLVRAVAGEPGVWREVRVPTPAVEGARHASRERTDLVKAQTRLRNQMGSWLAAVGCRVARRRYQEAAWWTTVQDWAGAPLAPALQARLARTTAQLHVLSTQLTTLEQQETTAAAAAPGDSALGRLTRLKGVGATSATVLLEEGLVWRAFRNRREVGGLLGYAPPRWASGELVRDQGTASLGHRRLKALGLQLAWNWVRWQPASALTRWYQDRFGGHGRAKRLGIVAVARKLIIALWRYVQTGEVPVGATLKTPA